MRQELKTFFAGLLGTVEVALYGRQCSCPCQCHSPRPRRSSLIDCQSLFEPVSALAVVTPHRPEPPQSAPQPERHLRLFAFQSPRESRPHVVVLGLQAIQPLKLILASELWVGLLCQGQEILGVNPLDLLGLCALLELLAGVLVDGLQHHEAWLPVRSFLLPQEALVQQGGDSLEGLHGQITFCVADGLYGFQGASSGEDRKPGEEHALAFIEKRVAPLEGSPQGPLPLREVTCSTGKELQAAAKPL